MALIRRYSSRRHKLDESFLNERLVGATAYDRIAGYFSSSILEVAGESIDAIEGKVRVVCNSDLDPRDVDTARAAHQAMRREWCSSEPERHADTGRSRFQKLYDLLRSGKLEVRVLPSKTFGLVHGKAGVITAADGSKTAFLGSANETYSAWRMNYELLWEDSSEEAARWVQEEFEALWCHPLSVPLSDFVIEDVGRIARRHVIGEIADWRQEPDPASAVVEAPVYRREYGLWAHQKYFVKLAFEAHRSYHGARFVLADMVGLGKTLQLALSAMLMALVGDKPILVLAPKSLLFQWQGEMRDLLAMPSAVWTGRQWVDENGIEHPASGHEGVLRCPRRVGIVSQGLITHGREVPDLLLRLEYECVIVDEAHRARRKNLAEGRENETPDPNNLLAFLHAVAPQTKSLLLATATPVQLYPVEAWDLLNVLGHREGTQQDNDNVLGNPWSHWRRQPSEAISVVLGAHTLPPDERELWSWVRNPLPPATEHRDFETLRRTLGMGPADAVADGDAWDRLAAPDKARVRRMRERFGREHNPFIRHIVRRTRSHLEQTIDPETGEPYLARIAVELFGEEEEEAIHLPAYLQSAYDEAEAFCDVLGERLHGSGFLRTLLLRRVGSTIHAGQKTAESMLGSGPLDPEGEEDDDAERKTTSALYPLRPEEERRLRAFADHLEANRERDPKFEEVIEILFQGVDRTGPWIERGCIVFSQYFDSVWWLAQQISEETLPEERIGVYAGGNRSGVIQGGSFSRTSRERIKELVQQGELRLLLGTDAASEGLNLQRLGSLINLDLPWNPTRLEQRKGRIQRIGQRHDRVFVYNMRYRGSVEDRVHELLSERLENIHGLFGQIPDVLNDVWVEEAVGNREEAKRRIDAVPERHPFEIRYHEGVDPVDWESCGEVLDGHEQRRLLIRGW
jgi:superfamily II DNA or RNA helicase